MLIWSTDFWIDSTRVIDITHDRLTKILEDSKKKENTAEIISSTNSVVQDSGDFGEIISDEVSAQIDDFEVENLEEKANVIELL